MEKQPVQKVEKIDLNKLTDQELKDYFEALYSEKFRVYLELLDRGVIDPNQIEED